jgi:DNA-binding transcriptional MerR regulator
MSDDDLLIASECSRLLGVSPARVRQLANEGKIPVQRTASGLRLFRASDVECLRRERMERSNGGRRIR